MYYKYCNINKRESLSLICHNDLLIEIDAYKDRSDKLDVAILKCSKCGGLWKKLTYNKITKWLIVGESSGKEYVPFDAPGYFPILDFNESEAYDYDDSLFCGHPKERKQYHNFTCSRRTLLLIKQISFDETIGYSEKISIFKCRKCNEYWKILEVFDSHKGTYRQCLKLNESVEICKDKTLTFLESEI